MSVKTLRALMAGCLLFAGAVPTVLAAIGSSASYQLEIADITNSGSSGSSSGYSLDSGIAGDNFDGQSSSASYNACAGFVEEAYSGCVTPPAPPPPPPPPPPAGGGGGGGTGGSGGIHIPPWAPQPTPTPTPTPTPPTPVTPVTPPSPPSELPPLPEEIPVTPGEEQPGGPSEPSPRPVAVRPPAVEKLPYAPFFPAELLDNVWCEETACYGKPALFFRAAAPQIITVTPWLTWLLIFLLILLVFLANRLERERERYGASLKRRKSRKK